MKTKLLAFSVVTLLALLHPWQALAQQTPPPTAPQYYPPYWHGPWHMWGDGGGFWWGGPLMLLGFLAVCILVFLLIRRTGDGYHHHHRCQHCGRWGPSCRAPGPDQAWDDPTYSAVQILNERFARGEIQRQEYDEKKAALLSGRPR